MPKFHPYRRRSLPAVFSVARGVHAAIAGPVPIMGPSAFFGLLFVHAERTHSTSNPFTNNHLTSSPNEPNSARRAGAAFFPHSHKNPKRSHFPIPTPASPVPFAPFPKRTQFRHNNHKMHNLPAPKPSTGCAETMSVNPWPRRRKRATPPRKAPHSGPPLARSSSFPRSAAGRPRPSACALPGRRAAPRWPPQCAPRRARPRRRVRVGITMKRM